MKKQKLVVSTVLVGSLLLFNGCVKEEGEGRKVIEKENKTITVIDDTKAVVDEEFTVEKIDVYEGIKGEDWLDDIKILTTKENMELDAIDTGDGYTNIRNLYLYDLNTKEEKSLADNSQYQGYTVSSPDKKHIFYVNTFENKGTGYIIDLEGNIKTKIEGTYIHNMNEARWVNNQELIMPLKYSGFYLANINGTITTIKDVEDIKKESIAEAIKVGDKIYYRTEVIGMDRLMKVYDINTKEKKLFTDERVVGFHLSPDKNEFIIELHKVDQNKTSLLLTDLEGNNKETLVEGTSIYGISWSPDGTKLAFVSNSREDGDKGLFILDLKTKKKYQVSTGYSDLQDGIRWSSTSKKIMINIGEVREYKWVDILHVITFK